MTSFLFAAAVLLGSSALASAHTPRAQEQPVTAASSFVGSWHYDLLKRNQPPLGDSSRQTLTGGPSGGPNQS